MTTNGQVEAATAYRVAEAAKVTLDPSKMTSRDMLRARAMLAKLDDPDLGGGRDSYDLLDDPLFRQPLVYWCIQSRTDKAFTWDQALDTEYGTWMESDEPDPQTLPASAPGGQAGEPSMSGSPPKPNGSRAGRRAAPTSA